MMRKTMSFDDSFKAWLRQSLDTAVPASVRAFSFNLYESENDDSPFRVDLIGSPDFDLEDGDWACEEVWEATPGLLPIPAAFSTSSWQTCLANVKALVLRALEDKAIGDILLTREGIAVGFVDGDLDLVWQR
jgi:hypothetical protein